MPVTPRRINAQGLPLALRGYERAATDKLLSEVSSDYEQIWKERKTLGEQVRELEAELGSLRERERLVSEALISAQREADATRQSAREEAATIVAEGRLTAEALVSEAGRERDGLEALVERLRGLADRTRVDLAAFLSGTLERLHAESDPPGDGPDPARSLVDDLAARSNVPVD